MSVYIGFCYGDTSNINHTLHRVSGGFGESRPFGREYGRALRLVLLGNFFHRARGASEQDLAEYSTFQSGECYKSSIIYSRTPF